MTTPARKKKAGKLKPCPFCGQSAMPLMDEETGKWAVFCTHKKKCPRHVRTFDFRAKAVAIRAWNKRAKP